MIESYGVTIGSLYTLALHQVNDMICADDLKFKILKLLQKELGIEFLAESLIYDTNAGAMIRYVSDSEREFIYNFKQKERKRLLEKNSKLIEELLLTQFEVREKNLNEILKD